MPIGIGAQVHSHYIYERAHICAYVFLYLHTGCL